MSSVKTKFEKIADGDSSVSSEPKPVRSITPPREGVAVEIENQPAARPADVVSAYEKLEDTLPDSGYIRSRKELFSTISSPDSSTSSDGGKPRIKSITPPREEACVRMLKEKTPERNENVIRESDRAEDVMPTAGQIKQTAAMFINGASRQKSIERSGITIEGELTEKGIAKSRLALFSDPQAMSQQTNGSNTEADDVIKAAKESGIAKERLNLFKNLEQQQNGVRTSPSKEIKKLKEFTPPPQLDPHLQRQYIIIDKEKEGSPSAQEIESLRDGYNKEEYVPESGLAKNRLKQYLEQTSSASQNTSNGGDATLEELQGKSVAKSLLAKWKSIENVKDSSPDLTGDRARKTSPTADGQTGDEFLPQSGHAKSLLNKWQNIDSDSNGNKQQRRGPRPITPPPPEELERIAVCQTRQRPLNRN